MSALPQELITIIKLRNESNKLHDAEALEFVRLHYPAAASIVEVGATATDALAADIDTLLVLLDQATEICMNALGAYRALRIAGLDRELPGFRECVNKAEEFTGMRLP